MIPQLSKPYLTLKPSSHRYGFKEDGCQFLAKECAQVLINRLEDYFFFFFFFFFYLGFTALSKIFHLYRADRSSKVGENRRPQGKKPDHP